MSVYLFVMKKFIDLSLDDRVHKGFIDKLILSEWYHPKPLMIPGWHQDVQYKCTETGQRFNYTVYNSITGPHNPF